jgi:hypothetical protein
LSGSLLQNNIAVVDDHDISLLDLSNEDDTFFSSRGAFDLPHISLEGLTGENRAGKSSVNAHEAGGIVTTKCLKNGVCGDTEGAKTVENRLGETNARSQLDISVQWVIITKKKKRK